MTPIMTLEHARAVRHNPTANRCELVEALEIALDSLARSEAELDRVEAHSLEQERLSTLGGIPPAFTPTWGNTVVGAGIHPDYVGRL